MSTTVRSRISTPAFMRPLPRLLASAGWMGRLRRSDVDAPAAREAAALVARLGKLARGVGVRDDAAAQLEMQLAADGDGGADRDRQVDVARGVDPAERAGVDVARAGLELGDDLHRAQLRRAGDR